MRENLVGEALKEARLVKGMTQATLGAHLGYSAMAISHFENGIRAIRPDDLRRASEILECDLTTNERRSTTTLFRVSSLRGGSGIINRSLQMFDRHIQKKYGNNTRTKKDY